MNYKSSFVLYCCLHLVYCPNKIIIKRLSVLYCCLHILVYCPNSSSFQISYIHIEVWYLLRVYIYLLFEYELTHNYTHSHLFCLIIAWYSKIYILLKEKKNLHTTVSKHNCFVWWIDNRQNHCCTERQWPIIFNKYSLSPHFLVAEPRGLEDMDQTRLQSFYNFCLFIVKYFS